MNYTIGNLSLISGGVEIQSFDSINATNTVTISDLGSSANDQWYFYNLQNSNSAHPTWQEQIYNATWGNSVIVDSTSANPVNYNITVNGQSSRTNMFTVWGTLAGSPITVNGGNAGDTFGVDGTNSGGDITLNGGLAPSTPNTFTVSSAIAPDTVTINGGGSGANLSLPMLAKYTLSETVTPMNGSQLITAAQYVQGNVTANPTTANSTLTFVDNTSTSTLYTLSQYGYSNAFNFQWQRFPLASPYGTDPIPGLAFGSIGKFTLDAGAGYDAVKITQPTSSTLALPTKIDLVLGANGVALGDQVSVYAAPTVPTWLQTSVAAIPTTPPMTNPPGFAGPLSTVIAGTNADDPIQIANAADLYLTGETSSTGYLLVNDSAIKAIIAGSQGNDWLIGGATADVLFGDAGQDVLFGGAGNEYLFPDFNSSYNLVAASALDPSLNGDYLQGQSALGSYTYAIAYGLDTLNGINGTYFAPDAAGFNVVTWLTGVVLYSQEAANSTIIPAAMAAVPAKPLYL